MIARVFWIFKGLAPKRNSAARLCAYALAFCALAAILPCRAFAQGLPGAQTVAADHISATSATLNAFLSDNGSPLIDCGFEFGTSEESLSRVPLPGKQPGNVSYELSKLSPNTQYTFRAYASNSEGIVYGNLITFTTRELPPPPAVGEPEITLSASSATLTFELETSSVLSAAVKYGESPKSLTLNPECSLSGSVLTAKLNKLEAGKTYYYECSASNEGGTTKGNVGSFTFGAVPTASESPAPSVSPSASPEASPSFTPAPSAQPTPELTPSPAPEPAPEPSPEPAPTAVPKPVPQPGPETEGTNISTEIGRFVLGESRPQSAPDRLRQANMRIFYDPKDPAANLSAALALCELGKRHEALIALRVSASSEETRSDSLLLAGALYLLEDDPASALDALSRIPDSGNTPYAHYARAMTLLRLGRQTDALSAARQAVALAPDDGALCGAQMAALYALGQYEYVLQAAESTDGPLSTGYHLAALTALRRTDGADALRAKLFALPENSAFERCQKAAAYANAGYANEALALIDPLKSDPHYMALMRNNPLFERLAPDIRWQFATNDYRRLSTSLLYVCLALLALVIVVWAIGRPRKKRM